MNDIDLPALRGLLRDTAAEIAALKAQLRRTWTRPMAAEQKTLCALKSRATDLCIIAALCRGRYHLSRPPRRGRSPGADWDQDTYHREAARRAADRYQLYRTDTPCTPEPSRV